VWGNESRQKQIIGKTDFGSGEEERRLARRIGLLGAWELSCCAAAAAAPVARERLSEWPALFFWKRKEIFDFFDLLFFPLSWASFSRSVFVSRCLVEGKFGKRYSRWDWVLGLVFGVQRTS